MMDWTEGEAGEFNRALASRHRLIRYDRPGIGLSAGEVTDFTWDRQLQHIDLVLDEAGEDRVVLFGKAFSGPLAIAYAALRPDRVSHLVLLDSAERIMSAPHFPYGVSEKMAEAITGLVLAEWGLGSKAIGQLTMPNASAYELAWYSSYQRLASSPEAAAAVISATANVDVSEYLPQIQVPTLVIHHGDFCFFPLCCGERLAEGIPGARLLVLDGSTRFPFFGDQEAVLSAIESFLNPRRPMLTRRELEVLGQAAAGLSNRRIGSGLYISEDTVARHLANVFIKLEVGSRGAAVARARFLELLTA
jgi:pimeloyl-ACP methyl ester carboxylesterase/DNA-binding CsgD family transcriptional regulator